MHIALITAGGAGMFCGSCMHDNTWARALLARGVEVSLVPTYTPIRLDEPDVSLKRVFFGGVNVYLNGRYRWWKHLPRRLTAWLDRPGVIQLATRWSVGNDAAELGELTLSMLAGEHGPHRAAIEELAGFLARDLRPDVIVFSNALLAGALAEIRRRCPAPAFCVLQGDDVFLDGLPEAVRVRAIGEVSRAAQEFDGFFVHSRFYREKISAYLSLPVERFHLLPLGIDVHEQPGRPQLRGAGPLTIGYFARFAPEKGFHHLVDAYLLLRERLPAARLRIGGYQGGGGERYLQEQLGRLRAAGARVENIGSPAQLAEKTAFYQSLDLFSVPTDFEEPKGMPVLEALANGVPVVQPAHGAFPEILEATGGGLLVPPKNPQALAEALLRMADPQLRRAHAERGWSGVREHYSAERLAERTLDVVQATLGG